jgi:hypothetical protein
MKVSASFKWKGNCLVAGLLQKKDFAYHSFPVASGNIDFYHPLVIKRTLMKELFFASI